MTWQKTNLDAVCGLFDHYNLPDIAKKDRGCRLPGYVHNFQPKKRKTFLSTNLYI